MEAYFRNKKKKVEKKYDFFQHCEIQTQLQNKLRFAKYNLRIVRYKVITAKNKLIIAKYKFIIATSKLWDVNLQLQWIKQKCELQTSLNYLYFLFHCVKKKRIMRCKLRFLKKKKADLLYRIKSCIILWWK